MFIRPAPSFVNGRTTHFIGKRTDWINWIIKSKSQRIEHGKHLLMTLLFAISNCFCFNKTSHASSFSSCLNMVFSLFHMNTPILGIKMRCFHSFIVFTKLNIFTPTFPNSDFVHLSPCRTMNFF